MRPADRLDPVTRRRIERDFADLRAEFVDLLGAETVDRCLSDSLAKLAGTAQINNFVPLLAQRFARQQLRALAQSRGVLEKTLPEVLFIDVRDAGRSQIAAVLLDYHAAGAVHVRTAGTDPGAELNPTVIEELTRRGLNVSRAYAKPLTDTVGRAADVVVTLACADVVPHYPEQRRYDWDVADPEDMNQPAVAALCDDIDRRVKELAAVLPLVTAHLPNPRGSTNPD